MNVITPSFYATISAKVRYDGSLNGNQKLLYAEITSLTSVEGYCWAPDEYFAGLYGVTARTIRRWIEMLIDRGYLVRVLLYGKKKDVIGRRLYLSEAAPKSLENDPDGVWTNLSKGGVDKNDHTCGQKCPHSNKYSNNDRQKNYDCYDFTEVESNKSARAMDLAVRLDLFEQIKENLQLICEDPGIGFDLVDSEKLIPCMKYVSFELVYREFCNICGRKVSTFEILTVFNNALSLARDKEIFDVIKEVTSLVMSGEIKNQFAYLVSTLYSRLQLSAR